MVAQINPKVNLTFSKMHLDQWAVCQGRLGNVVTRSVRLRITLSTLIDYHIKNFFFEHQGV